jgi:peptide/nickel transport system substrate-binding protein
MRARGIDSHRTDDHQAADRQHPGRTFVLTRQSDGVHDRATRDATKGGLVNSRRRLVTAILIGAAGVALLSGIATAAHEASSVTLTVGFVQDVDTFNPAVGPLVIDYEAWNIQYATLTDKAANDFHTIPGLATSWKSSNKGKTWTYTLRPNLKWSDGQPLTSADVAYTINRSRKEEWLNYTATTGNITASAPNPRTVVLRSSVPDPKLPTMDVYIVPQHIWSKVSKQALAKYAARDGVGSGPFTLEKYVKGQYFRMKANPNYWGGKPALDEVVFKLYTNPDAMVFALKKGEIDAAQDVPGAAFKELQKTKGIVAVQGQQGGFDELALNGYAGKPARSKKFGSPNPALKDLRFRQAIAYAINKDALVSRAFNGIGTAADAMSPSANPEWVPKIPASQRYNFDLDKAKKLLDDAGYKDTDGNGIRNAKGGGPDIVLRYLLRSESSVSKPIAQFVTGWLKQIGIGTKTSVFNDSQLTAEIGKGGYDMFVWGWTPFVDPDPQLSYFKCDQVAVDDKDFTNYYNDASWCDPVYDQLYAKQHVELNHAKRVAIVHQMLTRFYRSATYNIIEYDPDLQANRTDRFTGWLNQPAKTGPVIFSNTSPTYANLKPVRKTSSAGLAPGGIAGGVLLLALAGLVVARGGPRRELPARRRINRRT